MPENREHGRAPIELKVDYKKLNSFFADYTRNISKGAATGNLVFLSGVIPLNKAGNAVQGTTIEEQTRLVLDYIGAKLKSQGLGFENVVMSTVYMKNLNDFAAMNKIYA